MSTTIGNAITNQTVNYSTTAMPVQTAKAGGRTAGAEENGVTTMMELKTSMAGVTRMEAVKTGFSNTSDYTACLQEKYSYMNAGATSMRGVPVTVNVSGAFLKKCMGDPEKAAYLEENLAAIPDCIERSVNCTKGMPGSPVMTYCNISIDANGNISMMSGCTNDPHGKIARENAAKKAKQAREAQRDAQEAAVKKRTEQKKAAEKAKEAMLRTSFTQTRTLLFQGRDMRGLTNSLLLSLMTGGFGPGFDIEV